MNPVPEQVYTQARYRKTIYLNLNSKVCGCPLYSTQGDLCSNVSVSAEVAFSPVELRVASKTNPNVKVFGQPLPSPWNDRHCCAGGHCPRRLAKGHLTGKTDVKMLESRPEDALVKLVKLVNIVKLVKQWRLY